MGLMIEQIWIVKPATDFEPAKLVCKIWTCSADHHTDPRLLKTPHIKA